MEFGHRSKHLRPLRLRKVDGRAACVTQGRLASSPTALVPENPANVGHGDEHTQVTQFLADSSLQRAVPSAGKRVKLRI